MLLFPQPRSLELHEGACHLKEDLSACSIVALFSAVKDGIAGIALLSEPLLAREEYRLTIREDGVCIASSCDEGLYRAVTSLWQLI